MTQGKAFVVGWLILIAAIGYSIGQGRQNADRQAATQQGIRAAALATCKVQVRGLTATPYLTRAMADIALLITPPPQGTAKTPEMRRVYGIAADLRTQIIRYVAIQRQQPKHRTCGT